MTTLKVSQVIADILNNLSLGVEAKVNPIAPYANQQYSVTEPNGVVLTYLDTVKAYEYSKKMVDSSRNNKDLNKIGRFVISVGVRKVDELDSKCEEIENALAYRTVGDGVSELLPVAWSRMNKNEDSVYWRQIWFETTIRRRIER